MRRDDQRTDRGADVRSTSHCQRARRRFWNRREDYKSAPEGGDKLSDRFGDKSHIKELKNRIHAMKTAHWNSASETISAINLGAD